MFAKAAAAPTETLPLAAEKFEVVESLNEFAEKELLPMLKPVDKSWQPQDQLPDPSQESFLEEVADLRARAADLDDALLVSLVGDMITEEALPTYQSMLNTLDVVQDETGASDTPWARWTRAWTAEENRHGDLMNKYLWLTGRVDMRAVERTIQYLIGSGMDPKTDKNPYLGYIYTSFQERATKISHGNTARHAKDAGDIQLGKVCGLVAADEARHEQAYQRIVDELFLRDPEGTMLAYEDMMRKQIVMPAHLMFDGENENLWNDFSAVAESTGTYNAFDYADIIDHLNTRWAINDMQFTGDAAKGQEYVMKLPDRVRKLSERAKARAVKAGEGKPKMAKFSWIHNREVNTQVFL